VSETHEAYLYKGPDVTDALAKFVTSFHLDKVDPAVIDAAKVLILDGLGVMIAGAHHEVADILAGVRERSGRERLVHVAPPR
jgi:2-methylcitrate dehydratase PrpD